MNDEDYTAIADQAAKDQWLTTCRLSAQMTRDLLDAFIRQDFTRDEAFTLLVCRLEQGVYAHD